MGEAKILLFALLKEVSIAIHRVLPK